MVVVMPSNTRLIGFRSKEDAEKFLEAYLEFKGYEVPRVRQIGN